ncbi:MAG TPA: PD-(D/E)XK nuclease family protein [Pirellulaceae bacterium]|nr:PD-(D/E)XK nuclease family protein [Pirellulaceae bacterium]
MPIRRLFLDWSNPALPAAAEHLISRCAKDGALDLSGLIVVVPGGRAGRRLLEILVQQADEKGLLLTPPTITTEGGVPELLYVPKRPFADELTQKLAWAEALRSMNAADRQPLLPHPPPANDASRWLELGDLVRRIHIELAADGLDFKHVLTRGPRVAGFAEEPRWQALAAAQDAYHRRLDALGLWDIQTARLVAIKQREIRAEQDLVLVGAVDLNNTLRQMLDQVADRVTALIHAPQTLADRFDEHGCLVPGTWLTAEIPLAAEQIERADGPADQADAVACWLGSLGGRYRSDEVVIGAAAESLVPQLLRQLAQCGIAGRWVEGRRLAETAPYRLLAALAEYADRRQFAELARLVRHVDVESWMHEQTGDSPDWLTALDEYYQSALPLRLDIERLDREQNDERNKLSRIVRVLHVQVERLLAGRSPDQTLPLSQWIDPLRSVLHAIYGGRTIDRDQPDDRYLEQALRKIVDAIGGLRNVPEELQPAVTFRQAVDLALLPLRSESLPPPPDPQAVELLGWLELALDDAPALVVTSLNEGIVPKSATADSFLPNELRRHLELDDNDRRYARDAYALSVLAASRKELRLIVGHRDADGNPLAPSRLLFAADADTVARRAVNLFQSPPAAVKRRQLLAGLPPPPKLSALSPPLPEPLDAPLAKISVTQFRSYLACPYRYYLSHVLKLAALRDDAEELDGGMFGQLVHDVLEQFGRHEDVRQSAEAETIYHFLDERLAAISAARYGSLYGRPAVRMQVEQIRCRLRAFAEIQAQRTADGWRIIHSEDVEKSLRTPFDVDGRPMTLHGRIDRIDWHEPTNTILVLDYKTSDAGDGPEKVHRRGGAWVDLQLPLYRHLLRSVPLGGGPSAKSAVALGYFLLPKDDSRCCVELAEWSAEELAAADEIARDVIRKIRQQIFWPPADPPPAFSDELAPICQDHRLGSWQESLVEETP